MAISRRARTFWSVVLLTAIPLLLAAASGWLFAIRTDFGGQSWWPGVAPELWLAGLGVAVAVVGVVLVVIREYRQRVVAITADDELADLRVAMKDALQPLLRLVSLVAVGPAERRVDRLLAVAENASLALALLLMAHVDRARAAVYAMEPDGSALRVLAYGGRGEQPGDFLRIGSGADAAIDRVRGGRILLVHDVAVDPPPGYDGSRSDWRSVIAVPIVGGDGWAYGMVTVDSPTANSFQDTERHTVTVVAEILALAFSLAYPSRGPRRVPMSDASVD